MRATRLLMLMLAALAPTPAATAAAKGFAQGVAAGDVTDSQATIWTRAPHAGQLTLRYSTTPIVDGTSPRARARARAADDLTVHVRLHRLRAHVRYWYRFDQGKRHSEVGTFLTAPPPSDPAPVTFAWSGDADGTLNSSNKPAYGPFRVLSTEAHATPDFFGFIGDTIYADPAFAERPPRTLAESRAKYRLNLAVPALRLL